MIRRFYAVLSAICAILAALCLLSRPLRLASFFFSVLCVCCGAMWLMLRARDSKTSRFSAAAKWIVRVGNATFLLWLISFLVVEGLIVFGQHTDAQAQQADCVFVLGGGIRGDQPAGTLRERLAVALDVMEQNPDARVIVCGGQSEDEEYAEAAVMYNWMVAHGADPNQLTMESKSENTVQNIENAYAICQQNGWDTSNTAVLSSEFHLYRVRRIMEKCGLTPCAIAAPSGKPELYAAYCIREYFSILKAVATGY